MTLTDRLLAWLADAGEIDPPPDLQPLLTFVHEPPPSRDPLIVADRERE